MTNEYLKKIFQAYALHQDNEELAQLEFYIDEALNVMEIIKRIVKDPGNYYDPEFGDNKLYIDGAAEYLSFEEKQTVQRFFNKYCNTLGAKNK